MMGTYFPQPAQHGAVPPLSTGSHFLTHPTMPTPLVMWIQRRKRSRCASCYSKVFGVERRFSRILPQETARAWRYCNPPNGEVSCYLPVILCQDIFQCARHVRVPAADVMAWVPPRHSRPTSAMLRHAVFFLGFRWSQRLLGFTAPRKKVPCMCGSRACRALQCYDVRKILDT